jgi:hypothetical protein
MSSTNAPSPDRLVESARKLVRREERGKPRQTDLRRAVSTAYYALFHELSSACANCLVVRKAQARTRRAWAQAYRALQHRRVKEVCTAGGNGRVEKAFRKSPDELQAFGQAFVDLQKKREEADYDPLAPRLTISEVQDIIDQAEQTIKDFRAADLADKRAFCSFVVFDLRG